MIGLLFMAFNYKENFSYFTRKTEILSESDQMRPSLQEGMLWSTQLSGWQQDGPWASQQLRWRRKLLMLFQYPGFRAAQCRWPWASHQGIIPTHSLHKSNLPIPGDPADVAAPTTPLPSVWILRLPLFWQTRRTTREALQRQWYPLTPGAEPIS